MEPPVTDRSTGFRWSDTLIVVAAGIFGAALLGGVLIVLIYGVDSTADIDPAAQFWILLPVQVVTQIVALVWVSRRRGTGSLAADFGFVIEPSDLKWIFAGPLALFGLGLIAGLLRALLGISEENPQALLDTVAEFRGSITAVAIVLGVAVLGPVSEELTFRGLLLQTGLDKGLSPTATTVVSAAAFSLIHLVDSSLASVAGSITLVVLFLFGLFLAQLRIRTGSLAAPIFAHSGFNLTTVLTLFFFETGAAG